MAEATVPGPGDIMVERLTGRRVIVVRAAGSDEVTCRFADGRLEDRFTFELQPALPLLASLLSLVASLFTIGGGRDERTPSVADRVRPLLVRRFGSA